MGTIGLSPYIQSLMRDWSLALWVGISLVSGGMLTSSQGAIAETIASNSLGSKDQCMHPQMGLTACDVSLNSATSELNIIWPDGNSTDLSIGNDKTQVRYDANSEWQAAQYVGLCSGEQCFQAKATDIAALERGNEKIAAQCYDPMNGTSACYVQSSADTQTLTVSFLNGDQYVMTEQSGESVGLCVDNICAFNVPTQLTTSDRLAQADALVLKSGRPQY